MVGSGTGIRENFLEATRTGGDAFKDSSIEDLTFVGIPLAESVGRMI